MQVGVIGINHKSSELKVREVLASSAQNVISSFFSHSCVLLSTCNRTEIYFSAKSLSDAHTELLELLREGVDFDFEHFLYSYFGKECFFHLAKVTSGFDSVIFGETEIQRQVKRAYENAGHIYQLPSCMHYMFQKALKMGKDMRYKFSLPLKEVSLEAIIYELSLAYFPKPKSPAILFVGNSEINRKIIECMRQQGNNDIYLATRSPHLAKAFALCQKIELLDWNKISSWPLYDMVVCGTNQKEFLLKKEDILAYEEPISLIPTGVIIDLSVPRSVDPAIGKHPQISLFNMEEINAFICRRQKISSIEKDCMQRTLQEKVSLYLDLFEQKKIWAISCHSSFSI